MASTNYTIDGGAPALYGGGPVPVSGDASHVVTYWSTDAAGNAQSATSDLLTLIGSGFTPNSSATYSYDGLNRLTQVSLSDGTSIQYTWDASGNLALITVTTGQ